MGWLSKTCEGRGLVYNLGQVSIWIFILYSLNHVVPLSLQAPMELMWNWSFWHTFSRHSLPGCKKTISILSLPMQVVGPYLWSVRQAFYRVGTGIFLTFESEKSVLARLSELIGDRKARQKETSASNWFDQKYTKFGDIATFICHSQRLYVFQLVHSAGINRNDGDIIHTTRILIQFYWALSQLISVYYWCRILFSEA